jgi:hypothetical protein
VWALLWKRSLPKDVLQGVLIGLGLSILLIEALIGVRIPAMMTTVNGWQTTQACGVAGDPITQAACAQVLPAINAPNEAMYWQATSTARVRNSMAQSRTSSTSPRAAFHRRTPSGRSRWPGRTA